MKNTIYESIIKDSPVAYFYISAIKDSTGRYTDWIFIDTNKAFERLTGKSNSSLKGRKLSELISIEELDILEIDKMLKSCNKNKKYSLISYNKHLQLPLNCELYIIDDEEYIVRVTELHSDNIARSSIFRHSPFGLWIKDRDGKYLYVNKQLENLMGKTCEEIIGKTDYEVWGKEIGERFAKEDEEVMSTKEVYSYQDVFFSGILKKEVVYEVSKWQHKDKYNNILGTAGICIDIVKDVDLRNNIMQNQKNFESIINYSEDVFIISDRKKAIYVSPSFYSVFEDTPDRLYKDYNNLSTYFIEDDIDNFNVCVEERNEFIKQVKNSKDETRWLWVKSLPIKDERGFELKKITIVRDVTEKKNLEKELEILRVDFFSNISHELRTPINVIYGAIQLINKNYEFELNQIDENNIKHIHIIERNCLRLLRLVNNLIDITKLDSGCLDYQTQDVDIINFVEKLSMLTCDFLKESSINLVFDTEIEECIVSFDLDMMERVILNLLSNAIKFNKENGTIDVYISLDDNYVNISIKDSGIGIDNKNLNTIFGKFEQLSSKKIYYTEGSNVGLSLVKSLVDMHNGKITVESEINKGSKFTVSIPNVITEKKQKTKAKNYELVDKSNHIDIEFSDIYI